MKKTKYSLGLYVLEILNVIQFGGTAWESNPPDLARRTQAVLKTPHLKFKRITSIFLKKSLVSLSNPPI
ncbi:MAG: hypothetical protein Q8912_08945 [Bacillota bacterium]|nr:hypothetical protein [Bacillota bacterium]